jgi:hypothetical protein
MNDCCLISHSQDIKIITNCNPNRQEVRNAAVKYLPLQHGKMIVRFYGWSKKKPGKFLSAFTYEDQTHETADEIRVLNENDLQVQLEIVRQDPSWISYISNPYPQVLLTVKLNQL